MTPVEDVRAWLEGNGFGRFVDLFEGNEIDGEVLLELTDDDLAKLGLPLGPRKKLLKAITSLDQATSPGAATAPLESAPPEPAAPRSEAERRQLTVMFVDLVGSTALSGELDPEEMGAVIRTYQNAVAGEITRFEGHVAKFMGDGVLAYFGWPQAHEDDAERAVRAGLALVGAVGGLAAAGRPLAARIGIATGLVVVGELMGEGEAQERAVVGETPNLAARLQTLADPGSVIISQATRRLVGRLFELADLGPTHLKGFAEPLAAFRVEGEGRADGRFEALHGERLTPLIGREHELAMLLERWSRAKDGDGQVVLIAGEAGIGKSRLLRALREELGSEPHVALRHFCSPHHTNSALHPIITQLERAAGFASDDEAGARLAKLEALLGRGTGQLDEAVPLIGALLGIATDDRYAPPPNLSPQRQKQRTLEVLIEQLAGLARERPVLELYEDLHWADPSTLELLDLLVERVRDLPALAVLTYRPDYSPPWSVQAHVTALTMNRLGRRQGAAIVERVTGGKALPIEILEQIVARTDGVPLFVEELTRTVLESHLLTDAGDRYELTGPLPPLAIPATLHDSLMARLDRLAPVKEVAQTAAVIGREFPRDLLAAVSPMSEAALASALDHLVSSELVFRRGTPPEATYSFKHVLIQEVAYSSLLKGRRQQLHARIAGALEELFPETCDQMPEVLAHHHSEAGLFENAVVYWHAAARQSAARYAMAEAAAQSRNGLELLARAPESAGHSREELGLQSILAGALVATIGNTAAETGKTYARARVLCEQLGDRTTLVPVLGGLSTYHQGRGEFAALRQIALDLLCLGQEGDTASELVGNRSLGLCLYHLGELDAAREHLERVLQIYVPDNHRALTSIAAYDMRAVALSYRSLALLLLGYADQASRCHAQAMTWSRELRHPYTLAFSLHYAAIFQLLGRNEPAAETLVDELRDFAGQHRFPAWLAGADVMHGHLLVARAMAPEGLALARKGSAARSGTGMNYHQTYFGGLLAETCLRAGEVDEASAALAAALETAAGTGERWFEAELHRMTGECHLARAGDGAAAEACFQRAIETARSQKARSWELRAATNLARLWRDQGKPDVARELLAPIHDWFTEGVDTADLKDAKALLGELQ